jgi:hypothetical protein
VQASFQHYRLGTRTVESLFAGQQRLLEAELALPTDPAEQAAAHERWWARARIADQEAELRWQAAKASSADRAEARYLRLEAELALATAGAPKQCSPGLMRDMDDPLLHEMILLFAKDLFEATQARRRDLALARQEAAQTSVEAEFQLYRLGAKALPMSLEASQSLLQADLALAETEPDRRSALTQHWARVRSLEAETQLRYSEGSASDLRLLEAGYARLEAELSLLRDATRRESLPGLVRVKEGEVSQGFVKTLAKGLFDAAQASPRGLAQAKPVIAAEAYRAASQLWRLGVITISHVTDWSRRLLESELAATPAPADQEAAWQRHVQRMLQVEEESKARYESGRSSSADVFLALYGRLDAEIGWARAAARKEAK